MSAIEIDVSPPFRDRAAVAVAVRRIRMANARTWDTSDVSARSAVTWLRQDQERPAERM